MADIRSSDLDFNEIKNNLKTFLSQQSEFADYDFEASGLSNILDVLSYNTHLNGLIANFAINESFLNSSQLRASVLSHAEALGYYPRSKTGSIANISLSVNTNSSSTTNFVTLPAYTEFTTQVDGVGYTFQTLENYTATSDGNGLYNFVTNSGSTTIPIVEGTRKTKTFLVGEVTDEQVYVIPDESLDTSTMVVKVYTTATSSNFTTYTDVRNSVRITPESRVYIIREAANGYYEITFSDGTVLGTAPVSGNKIVIEYLATSGANANDAISFTADTDFNIDGTDYTLNVSLVSKSAGGSEKETIQSIKSNATIAFGSQQRMVTAEDYKAQILANFSSSVDDVIAWGGNDNVPPVYGRVYVSLKFADNTSDLTKEEVKNSIITSLSNNLAIMSIDTVFEDPESTFLELRTFFNFDPDLTGATQKTVESQVIEVIQNYFSNNLEKYNGVFRRSNLLSLIDDISPAILNSRMEVSLQQRFVPTLNQSRDYSINFPTTIADPDDVNYIITSSKFTLNGEECSIRNRLSSNILEVVGDLGRIIVDNIGSYNTGTGVVTLVGLNISDYQGESVKIVATPANQSTIKPLRNYLLFLDPSVSFARATIDYQNTQVVLT